MMSANPQLESSKRARDVGSPAVRRVLLHVLLLNALVVVIKLVVGIRTASLTVLGAALESGLTAATS